MTDDDSENIPSRHRFGMQSHQPKRPWNWGFIVAVIAGIGFWVWLLGAGE